LVKDKNFLIIDDVLTTGSTLNECACCLKQAGANKVFALALAGGN
jgi:predicted amidophosphoribosyltransferase